MRVVVAGGSGFVGQVLIKYLLEKGHQVFLLSRNPKPIDHESADAIKTFSWDGKTLGSWTDIISGADAVINLSGENIGEKRWTKVRKKEILDSRLDSTRVLVEAIKKARIKPRVFINGSAVGYYGHVENGDVIESFPQGKDFLADVCVKWEAEAQKASPCGTRVICLRTGVVLGRGGGALKKTELPFKLFLGGPLGSGKQWFPWIHINDLAKIIAFLVEQSAISGSVNATAPHPVQMKDFCRALGHAMHRPCWAPVPSFVLKMVLGEMSDMVLTGQKAIPKKLLEAGYVFEYPNIEEALASLYS